ncbi:hypothetical protein APSETT445_002963 [Aspergillus pseudonomiae]
MAGPLHLLHEWLPLTPQFDCPYELSLIEWPRRGKLLRTKPSAAVAGLSSIRMSDFLADENVGNWHLLIQEVLRHDPLMRRLPSRFDRWQTPMQLFLKNVDTGFNWNCDTRDGQDAPISAFPARCLAAGSNWERGVGCADLN